MLFVVWVLSRDPDDLSTSTEGEGVRMCRARFLQTKIKNQHDKRHRTKRTR